MGIEFFQSMMGRKFYEADVPRITKALERIADALEEQNKKTEGPSTEEMEEISRMKYGIKKTADLSDHEEAIRMQGGTK